jgi:hypothetical protein
MPAHRVHGVSIQVAIDGEISALSTVHWGIIRILGGQCLVPDYPVVHFVPLHPTLCLMGGDQELKPDSAITQQNMVDINRFMASHCRQYYFAQDLSACF